MTNLEVHFEVAILIPEGAYDIPADPKDWVFTKDFSQNVAGVEVSFQGYIPRGEEQFVIDSVTTCATKGFQDLSTILNKCGITEADVIAKLDDAMEGPSAADYRAQRSERLSYFSM